MQKQNKNNQLKNLAFWAAVICSLICVGSENASILSSALYGTSLSIVEKKLQHIMFSLCVSTAAVMSVSAAVSL